MVALEEANSTWVAGGNARQKAKCKKRNCVECEREKRGKEAQKSSLVRSGKFQII